MKTYQTSTVLLLLFGMLIGTSAFASNAPQSCTLNFQGEDFSFSILGTSNISGSGTITCTNAQGQTDSVDVKFKLEGASLADILGPNVGIGELKASISSTNVAVQNGPEDLLGAYSATDIQGGIAIGGAGFVQEFENGPVSLKAIVAFYGVGLENGFTSLTISPVQ